MFAIEILVGCFCVGENNAPGAFVKRSLAYFGRGALFHGTPLALEIYF